MCLKYRLRIEISYKGPSRSITGLYPHFSEYEQSCYRFPLQSRIALDACLHPPADETIVVGLLIVEVWGDRILSSCHGDRSQIFRDLRGQIMSMPFAQSTRNN